MDEEVIASPGGPDDPERVTIPLKILFSSVFESAKDENLPMPYILTLKVSLIPLEVERRFSDPIQ